VKQRGRENVGGLAAPSRQRTTEPGGGGGTRYARIRVKLSGARTLVRAESLNLTSFATIPICAQPTRVTEGGMTSNAPFSVLRSGASRKAKWRL
jgi:hypothetical protein